MQGHLETVLAAEDEDSPGIPPADPERALRRYHVCIILADGFACARCGGRGHDFLIAFPGKGRGACPACNSRRMAKMAAHLLDHVFPPVAARQWVPLMPKRLRWYLHHDPEALNTAVRILLDAIEVYLRESRDEAGASARGAAVGFIHPLRLRAERAYPLPYLRTRRGFQLDGEGARFHAALAPSPDDIEAVQTTVRERILRAFQRRGWLERADRLEMEQWHHGGLLA